MMEPAVSRDRTLLLLRLVALCGLSIASYLLYLAMTGQTAPGCGEGKGGCNAVLGSRWSQVLGLPVSAFAVGAYLVILAASIHAGPRSPEHHRGGAWRIIAFVGVVAGLSAIWFIALQALVLRGFCVYCMAAHACSLVIGLIGLRRARAKLPWFGALPAGAMVALQLLVVPPAPTFEEGGIVFDNFDTAAAPTLGDPDAPHVVALLFDYNCAFCRDAHRMVADAVEHYDGQIVAVMLPTAIDPACNPGAKTAAPHSQTSCELVRLALAVWLAEPDAFAAFDRELVEHAERFPDPNGMPGRYLDEARAIAERHVDSEQLDAVFTDPRIDEIFKTNGWVYENAAFNGRRAVPRLILAGRVLPGLADRQAFFDLLEKAYPGLAAEPQ